jgi:hypothetical protein
MFFGLGGTYEGNRMDAIENKIEEEALRMAKTHIQRFPPYYGQIPTDLIRNPKISPQAKSLYGLMHSYSSRKELNQYPLVEIAIRTMMGYMGVSAPATIWSWIRELKNAGWLDVIRQGKQLPNKYLLYPISKNTFQAWKGMYRVHLRISYDHNLAEKLKESLYKK